MKLLKVAIILLLQFTGICNAQVINTIAGTGFIGDGGSALSASFRSVWNVGVDASGNIYVADAKNNRIRKINTITGIITSVAGNGKASYTGDGGPATLAGLNFPCDVFVASSGNIYIADYANYVVRKMDAGTGVITTVAGTGTVGYTGDGGLATAATLGYPWRVCVDANENIYYTDATYSVVRRIDGASGIITTIAGTGTAGFSGDGGLATAAQLDGSQNAICMDASKNIYIADFSNLRIRKIDAVTGIINTVAGGGNTSNTDGILAINASLGTPRSVSVDTANNIYIGFNPYCRKVDAVTGIITTVVGSVAVNIRGFSGDGGPATLAMTAASAGEFVDKQGNIFVNDHINYRVRKVTATTGIINTIGGNGGTGMYTGDNGPAKAASLNIPKSAFVDNNANLYIADAANNRIRKIDAVTGIISTIAGNGVAGFSADGILAVNASITVDQVRSDSLGNIYFNDGKYRIRKINASTGGLSTVAGNGIFASTGNGGAASQASIGVIDFCFDAAGNMYVADNAGTVVRKIDAVTGIISTFAGNGVRASGSYSGDGGLATAATFGLPYSVCADNQNNVYIGDRFFGVVRKVTIATGIINTVAGKGVLGNTAGDGGSATAATLSDPSTILTDDAGNLYISDVAVVRKVDKATGIINAITGNYQSGFSGDGGLATAAKIGSLISFTINHTGTDLYICDYDYNRIRKVAFGTISLCPPSGNKLISSNLQGSVYHWQLNRLDGAGFVNLSDDVNFSGTATSSIQLSNILSGWSGYQLHCLVDGNYSNVFTLRFMEQWTGVTDTAWETAGNWSCTSLPDQNSDVFVDANTTIVINSNVTIRSLQLAPGAKITVTPGYTLTILF